MEAQTHRMADYPYPLHTNRELEMMLAGAKPFAVFAHERVEGFDKCDALAGQGFETHVARGTMSEHVRTVRHATGEAEIDYYFYALPGEEWRVEAYLMLLELLHRGAWCRQLEWLEGRLLGYTDEQNEYHLARAYPDGWRR
ncbi:hypothetical protein [Hoeflea sp. 108]|uniref:hypothetical protein n=1 Tax=Hoeflea sp. 108 TaxID=1116369 RepID=UPI00036E87F0|nr:hypothetical protein [Hoeflea sp. 108]